jgi:Domain of unknown function (DUF4416)
MADPRSQPPVLLVVALFSHHEEALAWGEQRLREAFGPIDLHSALYVFNQTTYYEADMGADLRKRFVVFHDLVAPDYLPEVKLRTNALETELTATGRFAEVRPLNLDPGLLSLGKFLLATTKDQAHRIYLRDGIFAEVTLRYQAGMYEPWPWTYADYRQDCVRAFLGQARDYYKRRLNEIAV